ncbi:hypothetical protein ACKFKG_01920 [Phormidesmis sp. 146-35]
MTDREQLLQELEQAPDELIAETLNFLRSKAKQTSSELSNSAIRAERNSEGTAESQPPSQSSEERIKQLKEWIANLPKNDAPLPEEALHRDSMYD